MKRLIPIYSLILFSTINIVIHSLDPDIRQSLSNLTQNLERLSFLVSAKYSQSRAHISIKEIRKEIQNFFPSYMKKNKIAGPYNNQNIFSNEKFSKTYGALNKYKGLISKALEREERFKDNYYVFYHAQPYIFRIIQDLQKKLLELEGKYLKSKTDFHFLRNFNQSFYNLGNLNTWIEKKFLEYLKSPVKAGEAFNNFGGLPAYLLATNLAILGNVGRKDSNTFKYFIKSFAATNINIGRLLNELISPYIKHGPQKAHLINVIYLLAVDMATNAVNPNGYQSVRDEYTIYTPEGQIFQIFIPKNMINQQVYLSKERGFFWHRKINGINQSWNPTKQKYLKISPVLRAYQNNPQKLDIKFYDPNNPHAKNIIIDRLEGRILLRGETFGNPNSGIKIYRYTMLDQKREDEYKKRVNIIANNIYQESLKN